MRKFSFILHIEKVGTDISYLLNSLRNQIYKNFEVIIVQDCDGENCEISFLKYKQELDIKYYNKEETGEGFSINYAINQSISDFYLIVDPDSFLASDYLYILNGHLSKTKADAFKGLVLTGKPGTVARARKVADSIFYAVSGKRKYYSSFTNAGFTREVFDKSNGFIISGTGGIEELFYRIQKDGFKIIFPDDLFIIQVGNGFWKGLISEFYEQGKSIVKFRYYSQTPGSFFNYLPFLMVLAFVLSLILIFKGQVFGIFLLGLLIGLEILMGIYWAFKKKSLVTGMAATLLFSLELFIYTVGIIVAAIRAAVR